MRDHDAVARTRLLTGERLRACGLSELCAGVTARTGLGTYFLLLHDRTDGRMGDKTSFTGTVSLTRVRHVAWG